MDDNIKIEKHDRLRVMWSRNRLLKKKTGKIPLKRTICMPTKMYVEYFLH